MSHIETPHFARLSVLSAFIHFLLEVFSHRLNESFEGCSHPWVALALTSVASLACQLHCGHRGFLSLTESLHWHGVPTVLCGTEGEEYKDSWACLPFNLNPLSRPFPTCTSPCPPRQQRTNDAQPRRCHMPGAALPNAPNRPGRRDFDGMASPAPPSNWLSNPAQQVTQSVMNVVACQLHE